MVQRVGTDIMNIRHIRIFKKKYDDPFFMRTFTANERRLAGMRDDPDIYFATRFAAKEAVFKSIGIDGNTVRLDDIEISNNQYGAPEVRLTGELAAVAEKQGIKSIQISLSWDGEYAVAFAVAEG